MRDMMDKFGAEVQSFRYSFVLPKHGSEWDGSNSLDPEVARAALAKARAASPTAQATEPMQPLPTRKDGLSAPRRRATDKQPTFIEIKPRI